MTFLRANLAEGGPVNAEQAAGCHRLALAHHLTDWRHLYLGPYPANVNETNPRNRNRDTAITRLIDRWNEIEDMVSGVTAPPAPCPA